MSQRRTEKATKGAARPAHLGLQHFPQLEAACAKASAAFLVHVGRESDPILSQISARPVREGGVLVQHTPDGTQRADMQAVLTKVSLSREAVRETRIPELIQALVQAGKEMASQQVRMLLDLVTRITAQTGNIVSGAGRPAFEALMDALEKVEVDFESGRMRQTLLMNPEMKEQFEKAMSEWMEDPEKRRRWDALMKRKRRAYVARERSRKLVD